MPRQNIEDILKEAPNALDKKPKVETELIQELIVKGVRNARNALDKKPEVENLVNQYLIRKWADNALNKKPEVETSLNQVWALQRVRIQLNNELVMQALRYRGILFYFLLVLMTVETLFLFLIVCVTAEPYPILIIPDRTLQIIVGATIIQISAMVIVIIKSVYPKDLKQLMDISKELSEIKQ